MKGGIKRERRERITMLVTFLVDGTIFQRNKKLKEGVFILAYSLRKLSIMVGKTWCLVAAGENPRIDRIPQDLPPWPTSPSKPLPPRSSTPFQAPSSAGDQVFKYMSPWYPVYILTIRDRGWTSCVQCKMQNEYMNLFLKAKTFYFIFLNVISPGEYHLHLFPETTIKILCAWEQNPRPLTLVILVLQAKSKKKNKLATMVCSNVQIFLSML